MCTKESSCFDRLSTNWKRVTISEATPFTLSVSKGERQIFHRLWQKLPRNCHAPRATVRVAFCRFRMLYNLIDESAVVVVSIRDHLVRAYLRGCEYRQVLL